MRQRALPPGAGKPHSGYLVVFIALDGVRPVGVAMDRSGALLVADDVGNIIWRVAPPSP